MATDDLIALPRFSYTALDFETIVTDIKRVVRENPEYNENWEDFLESNAGRMLIELSAYVMDLLAFRVDWKANESYLATATQTQSVIELLKLINYRLTLPGAASVITDAVLSNWVEPFDLPTLLALTGTDRNGDTANFELILKDSDGDFIYFGDDAIVTLNTGTIGSQTLNFTGDDALTFYEGSTNTQEETMTGTDNELVVLTEYPVIDGSIQIWTLNATGEEVEKLPEVDSFVSEEAQLKDDGSPLLVPPFVVDVDANSAATVKFASSDIANVFAAGDTIKIYYRVGGGTSGNVVTGAIKETKSYVVGGNPVMITFTNNEAGANGTNAETVDEARRRAPLYVTTADKTVTPLDYKRTLMSHSNVMLAVAYGKVNEPAEIAEEYGYTIPTFESWIYIVPSYVNWSVLDPRTEYNTQLQITKPYEVKSDVFTFPAMNILTGTISFDPSGEAPTKVTGAGTLFSSELSVDDVIAIPGTGTGSEIYLGVVALIETGVDDVLYLKEAPSFGAVNQNYGISSYTIQLPSEYTPVYQRYPAIDVAVGLSTYLQNVDYIFDYVRGLLTRYEEMGGYGIPAGQALTIGWWWWDQATDAASDITTFENYLANKKMLCIDNVYLDTLYTAFDVKGTVYVEKNYNQELVKEQVNALMFLNYSLLNRDYAEPIVLPEIIALVQSIAGVRYLQVDYFGKDYETYKVDPVTPPAAAKNYGLDNIETKYDEIMVISNNEFEGASLLVAAQIHGVMFDYVEVGGD